MPVHSTWLWEVVTPLLGKRSELGAVTGSKHVYQHPKTTFLTSLEGDVSVWRSGLVLNALAGSNSSAAVFVCKGIKTKKLPLLGAFSTKMAEEEGFEPS